jgi:hypothetical protein
MSSENTYDLMHEAFFASLAQNTGEYNAYTKAKQAI